MTEPAADGQTAMPGGQTIVDSVPGSQTAPSSGQTARAQEAHGLTEDEASPTTSLSSPHTEVGGQTAGPGGPTTSSCRVDARRQRDFFTRQLGGGYR
jgi:hypothetical protein